MCSLWNLVDASVSPVFCSFTLLCLDAGLYSPMCWYSMSVIMIFMFLVAWSPYSIVCLWASFGDPKKIPPSMAIIAPLFAKSSTFYNPCIYVVANKKFRRAMFAMFKCQTHRAMPVTSILPMDVPQNQLASGRI